MTRDLLVNYKLSQKRHLQLFINGGHHDRDVPPRLHNHQGVHSYEDYERDYDYHLPKEKASKKPNKNLQKIHILQ